MLFYRARYYSPELQRFLTQDPIGFAGGDPNLYAYALNTPTVLRDALGTTVFSTRGGETRVSVGDNDIIYQLLQLAFQDATPIGSALKEDPMVQAATFARGRS
jgi:uncharacterized protein RhaS with RHS repeats